MKLEHSLTPYTKINSKWIKDLKCKARHSKTLRGKHRQNNQWNKSQQDLFDPPTREMERKTKINKWDLMKLQSSCTAKETINKTKRQPSEWEKIFANEATDKRLISKIYKQVMQLNIKKQTTQSKIWAEDLNRHFSKKIYRLQINTWKDAQHH